MVGAEKSWWVYILLCADGTLYTGMTDDIPRRLRAHNTGRGAKYTRGRRPVLLVYRERCASRSQALRREAALKRLSRSQKWDLIQTNRNELEGMHTMEEKQVRFFPADVRCSVPLGSTLMEACRAAGLWLDSPCGGNGTCGKCRVELRRGTEWVSVLACQTPVTEDLEVRLPQESGGLHILTDGAGRRIAADPLVRWYPVSLADCRRSRSLWEGFSQALHTAFGIAPAVPSPAVLGELARYLAEETTQVWALLSGETLLALRADPPAPLLLAFDLGTTTLAGYLLDGVTGETLAVGSDRNPQASFGADVIARIDAARELGPAPLREALLQTLSRMTAEMAARAGRPAEEIVLTVLAGNTCMHHLALGLSPASLGLAPYLPVLREPLLLPAAGWNLPVHPAGQVAMLPNLAGFVGADTVACLLAGDFVRREELTLLLDIGTNGELVLGNRERRITCSTAAGPAFEGAKIRCGMRGAEGAIDHVHLEDGRLVCHVIGEGAARGICGSGLLDAVAALLDGGVLDESGCLLEPEELSDPRLAACLTEVDGASAVLLAPAPEPDGEPVVLTQKDIRELQLAKGAIAAGIHLLAQAYGAELEDIQTVLIAGAFGNFMRPESACRIGLIPPQLLGKIRPVGNAAGEGACLAALSWAEYARCASLASGTEYLELAQHPGFSTCYMEEMAFPEG
ncbi:ASKHA domain-containing protein [Pseudoflavonifractor sp. MCC625]|uniref:ASKHA domain-containing protein n=1 Tax=Pseudoflavonifractor sp. MCC625 TaxID=2592647 RepID=UPI001C03700E|nr:ASKHA domain-containing protein [Pseudoflavonifractor sp. MCC625]MBT9684301.1 DUF4445 domain-containing protein [Pseudoflavonifractor sp. MCC625]